MLELKENVLDTDTYLYLRKKVGWIKLTDKQAEQAVNNSLLTVCAYLDGKPVGMGRVIGDGAVISYIQDLVVIPEAQKKGVGRQILLRLKKFVEEITEPEKIISDAPLNFHGASPYRGYEAAGPAGKNVGRRLKEFR